MEHGDDGMTAYAVDHESWKYSLIPWSEFYSTTGSQSADLHACRAACCASSCRAGADVATQQACTGSRRRSSRELTGIECGSSCSLKLLDALCDHTVHDLQQLFPCIDLQRLMQPCGGKNPLRQLPCGASASLDNHIDKDRGASTRMTAAVHWAWQACQTQSCRAKLSCCHCLQHKQILFSRGTDWCLRQNYPSSTELSVS